MSDFYAASAWSSLLVRPMEWTVRVAEPERDDQTLVAACLAGDKSAFDEIVERHRRAVYTVCFRFANNHEDASDLAQETFVRAWRGLPNFRGQAALSTWLYRIAVNVSLNRVGAKKPEAEAIEPDRLVDTTSSAPGDDLLREERA